MTTQDKIDILKDYLQVSMKWDNLYLHYPEYQNAKLWLQELEQSNNKDNIDNWNNRELFNYCVENELITDNCDYESFNDLLGRKLMIEFISIFKSQK